MPFLIILALVIALGTVLFALQNTTRVVINFFGWQFQGSLALILLITLALGVLVGLLVEAPSVVRRSLQASGHKRQVQDREYQLQVKDQEILAERQQVDRIRAGYQELFTALAITEPTTGLLRGESVVSAVSYRLQQMATAMEASQPSSAVCVYLLEPNLDSSTPLDATGMGQVQRAIADRLRRISAAGNWLHHDSQGRFACIATGLDVKAASDYGEAIRASFADQPLALEDETSVSTTVSLGGAIAMTPGTLDALSLMQQAEAALEQAKRRGRNRFRLVEAR